MPITERPARRGQRPQRPRELGAAGVRPAKALGQHFLTDLAIADRIVAAGGLGPDDVVIEVGPGLGVLTERLVEAAGRVIAVEIDGRLAARLAERLGAAPNLSIVTSDVLAVAPEAILAQAGLASETPYSVVANLPYNIGAAVLRHFLEAERPPRRLVVMLQQEVADSIAAEPGRMGLLGVAVQVYAEARSLFSVSPEAFYPPPKVTSGVIELEVRPEPLAPAAERERFFAVVRAGFSSPRKQLRNSLANGLKRPIDAVAALIEAAGLDATRRPQDLTIDDWLRLSRQVGGV